ncbi:MAG: hypothetical protein R3247_17040 [Rhodothermales bacterium]|nr:hypothetical protein [Rhodothermales bacterium]
MLAFLAMMMMMFFALNQNRATVQGQQHAASTEMEVMAHGIASETMQFIATHPFDANISGSRPQNTTTDDLTPPGEFGSGRYCERGNDECEDIDDFNQMQPDTLHFTMGVDANGDPMTFPFMVTARVAYVDADGNESAEPTWTKEVTILVDQVAEEGGKKYLLRPVVKTRRFSPQW